MRHLKKVERSDRINVYTNFILEDDLEVEFVAK